MSDDLRLREEYLLMEAISAEASRKIIRRYEIPADASARPE